MKKEIRACLVNVITSFLVLQYELCKTETLSPLAEFTELQVNFKL